MDTTPPRITQPVEAPQLQLQVRHRVIPQSRYNRFNLINSRFNNNMNRAVRKRLPS
jgi:hypothetical protein